MGIAEPCKMVVIGAGNMALEHLKAFSSLENVEIIGIMSRTRSKAVALAEQFKIPTIAESIDELYQKTKAGLVVVTVYETSMLEVALAVMNYDWTIFLEKPPGYNLQQAEEISMRAYKNSRKVLVGLNRRFLSSSQRVMKSLNENNKPRSITVFDQQSLDVARSFNHHEEVVKYWMYANSIHLVDYLSFFGRGEVTDIQVSGKWDPMKTLCLNAFIKFSSGDEGLYQGIWNAPGPWGVYITTGDIRWEMRPLEKATFQLAGERQLHETEIHEWDKDFKPGFKLQAIEAVQAALGQKSNSPIMDEALKTMKIVNKIYSM
jgi:predicted dehydrogenase